jgi:hypothetical protein
LFQRFSQYDFWLTRTLLQIWPYLQTLQILKLAPPCNSVYATINVGRKSDGTDGPVSVRRWRRNCVGLRSPISSCIKSWRTRYFFGE